MLELNVNRYVASQLITTVLIFYSKITSNCVDKSYCLKSNVLCCRRHIPAYTTM
jgi:hypothetical protein